ncbi:protein BPS1, chloroplastic-like [Tasmannia lanceolata]|uniref:protein BPS1, chloroplastic-like n=1 Tax=Tasmannia lanceolata TaxID=3420 RepID=UPI00406337B1
MGRVFLTCFPTFLLKGKNPYPSLKDDASWFCSSLSEDLEKLGQSLINSPLSFQWATQAMNLLKKMQVDFLLLVEKSQLPFSFEGEYWLDQYMQETVILLDFCNLLKSAISRIERYRMEVDFTTTKMVDGSLITKNKIEIEGLERETMKHHDINNWRGLRLDTVMSEYSQYTKCKKSMDPVIFAVKSTMIIISLFIGSTIISSVSIDMEGDIGCEIPQVQSLTASLRTLIYRFRERIQRPEKNSSLGLVEHEMVERAVAELKAQVEEGRGEDGEKLLRSVDSLKKSCVGLKEGLEMFDTSVTEVFDEVIKGRNKLLEMFSAGIVT